jgi:hypothetical protein
VLAGFRFPREVIAVAARWYLRYGLSCRDVEELLAEPGVIVDHVTIYRWVQRFATEFIEAARPCRHLPGDRWLAWQRTLFRELRICDAVVFLNSRAGQASMWCHSELVVAAELGKRIYPLDLGPDLPPHPLLRSVQGIGFDSAFDIGVQRLTGRLESDGLAGAGGLRWERGRPPYPGLAAMDVADAGVFLAGRTKSGTCSPVWTGRSASQAADWKHGHGELLGRDATTDASSWLARGAGTGTSRTAVGEYIHASRAALRRRRTGLVSLLCIIVVAALAASVLAVVAAIQRSDAVSQSRLAQSEEMAAEATNLLTANGPLAMLVSLQAYERAPTLQAESALIEAAQQPLDNLLVPGSPVESVKFSPDGCTLATGDDGGDIGLWNVATGHCW